MSRKAATFGALLLMLMMAGEGSAKAPRYFAEPGSAAPFSAAVRAGDFIFASGQIGITADGEIPASIEDQARLAMNNLQQAFKSAGADLSDAVKCTVMLDDMKQWPAFNQVYVSYFKPGHLPARSAFGADGLALGAGVEVECIAYKPLGGG